MLSESPLAKASASGSVRRWGQASAIGSVSRLAKGMESRWARASVPQPRSLKVPPRALLFAVRANGSARLWRPRPEMAGSARGWRSVLWTVARSELR